MFNTFRTSPVFSMPAEGSGEASAPEATVTAATETKRPTVSERIVLDAEGKAQDGWIGAKGITYKSLTGNFDATIMFADLPVESYEALAAFGALTAAGNVTNTVRNGKAKGDATEKSALEEWLQNLKEGNWTSARGDVEAGLNLLATAFQAALAKDNVTMSDEQVREQLKSMTKEERADVRKHPAVKVEITRIAAEKAAANAAASGDKAPSLAGLIKNSAPATA